VSALGVTYAAVYQTMDCKPNSSRQIRLKISELVGMLPSMIWAGELPHHKLLVDDFYYMHPEQFVKTAKK
jgi:hypothetical protein